MSIDRRPNGRWRVRYPGAPSRSFDRKLDAENFEREVRRLKQVGRLDTLTAGQRTLADLAAEHMKAERPRLADATWRTYRTIWSTHVDERILGDSARQWSHAIADASINSIRPRTVEQWRDDRLSTGAGPQSLRKTMALMQSIFERAVRDAATDTNPVKAIRKPSGKRVGTVPVIAPDAVERIRSRLDDTGAVMVSVLAYAGLRPGEVRALRWEHVGRKTLRVELGTNPDGTVKPTKTEDARNVELVAALAADLKAWRAQQGMPADAAHIFPRANGKAWTEDDYRNWRGRKFIPAVAAAGVTIKRPYDLRHSIASLWLQAGVNPVKVAEWLGHNVAETYKTYAHVLADLDPTDRTSAADRIAKARQDISGTHEGVKQGATKAKRKRRNGRARAKSAAGAGPT